MIAQTTQSDDEYPSAENSQVSDGSESSTGLKASGNEDSTVAENNDAEEFKFVDVNVQTLSHESLKTLDDSDTELWLVRMPRHKSLRDDLHGSEVVLEEGDENKHSAVGRKAGSFKGSYVYRDHGPVDVNGPRAAFITKDENGEAKVDLGKRFAKLVSVTFAFPLKVLDDVEPLPKRYPQAASNQSLKYHPIGSARSDLPKLGASSLEILSQHRLKQANGIQSPAKLHEKDPAIAQNAADVISVDSPPQSLLKEKQRKTSKEVDSTKQKHSKKQKRSKREKEEKEVVTTPSQANGMGLDEENIVLTQTASPKKEKSPKKKKHSKKEKRRLSSQDSANSPKRKKKRRTKEEPT